MSRGKYCVAGIDVATGDMVRPLTPRGENWTDLAPFAVGFCTGLSGRLVVAPAYPHGQEDFVLDATPRRGRRTTEREFYELNLQGSGPDLVAQFGATPLDAKYFVEGTRCRSLVGVRAHPSQLEFTSEYGKLRLKITDEANGVFAPKVTCDRLIRTYGRHEDAEDPHDSLLEANEILHGFDEAEEIVIRVGLARAWDGGPLNQWNPKRCYIQANGIVLPRNVIA